MNHGFMINQTIISIVCFKNPSFADTCVVVVFWPEKPEKMVYWFVNGVRSRSSWNELLKLCVTQFIHCDNVVEVLKITLFILHEMRNPGSL